MTTPNQITVCASSDLRGIYVPEVRIYASEPHPRYGLLPTSYFFKGKTRCRKTALKTAQTFAKAAKAMTPDDARAFLAANGRDQRW
jgi:hypothetical protein